MAHTGIDRRPTHLLDPNINTMILQGPRVVNRPPSSAGRPASRIGNAPTSKPFHRLPQRQITRLISSSHSLVSQVTGLNPDDDESVFRAMVDTVTRSLDYNVKAAPSSSMSDIAKLINGFVFPSRCFDPLLTLM